jgi:hypothetical protein
VAARSYLFHGHGLDLEQFTSLDVDGGRLTDDQHYAELDFRAGHPAPAAALGMLSLEIKSAGYQELTLTGRSGG